MKEGLGDIVNYTGKEIKLVDIRCTSFKKDCFVLRNPVVFKETFKSNGNIDLNVSQGSHHKNVHIFIDPDLIGQLSEFETVLVRPEVAGLLYLKGIKVAIPLNPVYDSNGMLVGYLDVGKLTDKFLPENEVGDSVGGLI